MEGTPVDLTSYNTLSERWELIMRKIYYQMTFIPKSPFRIGNGSHELSDSDLLLDNRNLPFIPGTSIAGIIRHRVDCLYNDKATIDHIFGIVDNIGGPNNDAVNLPSSLIIGDAVMGEDTTDQDVTVEIRDGVGLNEWGTAIKGSKFDFQISESDKEFCSIIEWTGDDSQYKNEIEAMIEPVFSQYIASGFHAGARTTRGYGNFDVTIKKLTFLFPDDLDQWISFNPYQKSVFENAEELMGVTQNEEVKIDIVFKMKGPFSVRVNTARSELMEDGSIPDTLPMENMNGNPVIPGTVWAGVFRHHMHDLMRDTGVREDSNEMKELDSIFGIGDKPNNNRKSRISFSESEIIVKDKEKQKTSVMRTAIDRFTASPKNAALFTNMVYIGGKGSLQIRFDKDALPKKYKQLLMTCIYDLHLGLITVGGEASVGRGILQIANFKVNGLEKSEYLRLSSDNMISLDLLEEVTKDE